MTSSSARTFSIDASASLRAWSSLLVALRAAEAENTVRSPVWTLSTMSAGFYVDFQTESSFLQLNITYRYETMSMWHFPATGCSGMDLYNFDYNTSTWRWTSTTTIMKYPQSINHMITVPAQSTHPTEIPLYRLHLPKLY